MKRRRGLLLIVMGLLLIAAALCLTVFNLYDADRAAQSVQRATVQLEQMLAAQTAQTPPAQEAAAIEIEIPDYILNPNMEMPVQNIDGQDYVALLEIPVLGLKLPVISQWSYAGLRIAPCRYSGSAYTGDLVIAAHNYPAYFGTLKTLYAGDEVILTDMDGNVFTYTVAALETLRPTQTREMKSGDWDLTLFTCTVGGSYRVAVRCSLVNDQAGGS